MSLSQCDVAPSTCWASYMWRGELHDTACCKYAQIPPCRSLNATSLPQRCWARYMPWESTYLSEHAFAYLWSLTAVCSEFVCMLNFSILCDECCLTLHECHFERNFHFFLWICACGSISLYSFVVFVLFVVSVLGSELSTKKDDYHWLCQLWLSCRCSWDPGVRAFLLAQWSEDFCKITETMHHRLQERYGWLSWCYFVCLGKCDCNDCF